VAQMWAGFSFISTLHHLFDRLLKGRVSHMSPFRIRPIRLVGHSVKCTLLVLAFFAWFSSDAKAQTRPDPILASDLNLTDEEKSWLHTHPVIKIGLDSGYAPYSMVDNKGQFVFIAPDFLRVLEKRLGIVFAEIPNLTWPEILDGAKNKSLDVIATAVKTPEREEFLSFSQIYLPTPLVIMSRRDDVRIRNASDLNGKRLALVRGYFSSERVIADHPGALRVMVDDPLAGLTAVAVGEADAYVGVLGINAYLSAKHGLSNLKVASRYNSESLGQRFAVRKDWEIFARILDKALDDIAEDEKAEIFGKWIPVRSKGGENNRLKLSDEEISWVADHPEVTIAMNKNWPPMDFVDASGDPLGIGIGYVRALERRLPIRFKVIPGDWSRVFEDVKKQRIDAILGITPTAEREEFFNFTDQYITISHSLFSRRNDPVSNNLSKMSGKRVVLEKGFFLNKLLAEKHPQLKVSQSNSTLEALLTVSRGDADVYIGNRAVANYLIETKLINNVRESGVFDGSQSVNSIGVRKDWPVFRDILQKALNCIDASEVREILAEWLPPEPISLDDLISPEQQKWIRNLPLFEWDLSGAGRLLPSPVNFGK